MIVVYVVTFSERDGAHRGDFHEEVAFMGKPDALNLVEDCRAKYANGGEWVKRLPKEAHIVEQWENRSHVVWLEALELRA